MFFTVFGYNSPRIERAGLDGSNRQSVVSDKVVYPVGLALDLANSYIYWIGIFVLFVFSNFSWKAEETFNLCFINTHRYLFGRHRASQLRWHQKKNSQERLFGKDDDVVQRVLFHTV
jgi:hypothetical protein